MSLSADENLLYGVLAFQLGFIEREVLVSSLNEWIKDKSRPLSEILRNQGHLTENVQELLDSLVEEHLKKHEGQPEKSLAAVSSLGSIREELEQFGDVDLNATLGHLPADTTLPGQTGPLSIGSVGQESGGRFRVVKIHAKGGLGQVSVAVDEELSREVALKELQSRFADDQHNRARFSMEAEITGALEHPGIVPVYGAGHYADGRPYYAMRFVRGDSLHDAIKVFHQRLERGDPDTAYELELRKLLQRFIDVCDAIEYAHSRGVLHRDLKPGNIMLGKYGETLVVDWGLAKAQGRREPKEDVEHVEEKTLLPPSASGSAPTQMGSAVGTPHYMSPEQAGGKLDELGPASDVYSLGATLYCLLTGHAPFSGKDVGEILAAVQLGIFPPPRKRNPEIAKPLEAICLKAMAKEPESRYVSPRVLAEDVERWLADQKVQSYQEPLYVQASRWLRKNRVVAGALLSALAVAFVAALVITGVLADSNQKLADKEAAAVEARDEAIEARNEATDLAEKNRQLALDSQRQVAETYRQQGVRLLEGGDMTAGLPMLVKSIDALPQEDTKLRELAIRNLTAWNRSKMRLVKIRPAPLREIGAIEDTNLLLAERYVIRDNVEQDSEEATFQEDMVFAQLLDLDSLQEITPEIGPAYNFVDFTLDVDLDRFYLFFEGESQEIELSSLEQYPQDLMVNDENRDRLVAVKGNTEIRVFRLSDAAPLGEPLKIEGHYFFFQDDENLSFVADGEQEMDQPVSDELIGLSIKDQVCAVRSCITQRIEMYSLESAERLDVEFPLGDARLGERGHVAIQIDDKTIKFFNSKTGKEPVFPLKHDQNVIDFEFNNTGNSVVTLTEDGRLHVWPVAGLFKKVDAVSEVTLDGPLDQLVMVGNRILTTTQEDVVQLWSVQFASKKVELLRTLDIKEEDPVAFLIDAYFTDEEGSRILLNLGNTIVLWNPIQKPELDGPVPFGAPPEIFSLTSEDGQSVEWNLSKRRCATYCNGKLTLWHLNRSQSIDIEHEGRVVDLLLSDELQMLAAVDSQGVIRIWDYSGQLLSESANTIAGRRRRLLGFSGDKEKAHLVVSEQSIYEGEFFHNEQNLQVWELPSAGHESQIESLYARNAKLSSTGDVIYRSNDVFDVSDDGRIAAHFIPGRQKYSSEGNESIPGKLTVYEFPFTSKSIRCEQEITFQGYSNYSQVTCSTDGQRVALARLRQDEKAYRNFLEVQLWSCEESKALGPAIKVWDPYSLTWQENQLTFFTEGKVPVAFDSQLRFCVVGVALTESLSAKESGEGQLKFSIWDLTTGKSVGKPLWHEASVQCVEFSPDGKLIATGSEDGLVKLWDGKTGEMKGEALVHNDSVKRLHFLPDGKRLITITNGRVWRTWDLEENKTLTTPVRLNNQGAVSVGLSEDGNTMFSGGGEGRLQEWDVLTGIPIGPPRQCSGAIQGIMPSKQFVAVSVKGDWELLPRYQSQDSDTASSLLKAKTYTGAIMEESGLMRSLLPEELAELNSSILETSVEDSNEYQKPKIINVPENALAPPAPAANLNDKSMDFVVLGRN